VIENYALPLKELNNELILLQDRSISHTARYKKDKFTDLNLQYKQNPPHSPSLNPVEMIWGILKRYVSAKNPNLEKS
jgi:transposase